MEDFFGRVEGRTHGWPAGRRDLHWHVLPPDTEVVRAQLTDPYRALTHRPGLAPVAPEWIHLTVVHGGPEDSASGSEVEQIVEKVRVAAAQVSPFTVRLARPGIGQVAIECAGRPGSAWRHLRTRTQEAMDAVVGNRWPSISAGHYPHASIAYATADAHVADREALKDALSDLHVDSDGLTIPVTALTLVSQWHDRQHIKWEVLAQVPLTPGRDG
ncbi:2'-5' RNA ligase family protein [Streptomyces sp. NPDC054863]